MKKKIFLAITALTLFVVQACKMDGLDKDPNRATVVTPDLVLNGICNSIFVGPWDDEARFWRSVKRRHRRELLWFS